MACAGACRVRPVRVLLPGLLLLAACAGESSDEPGRGILVVAVDALRWDHTSFAGYDRDTTPRLREWFEEEGFVFADAWTPGPDLLPAHMALLTGCDPTVCRRPDVVLSDGATQPPITRWFVPEGVPTLAEELLSDGWHTAAFGDRVFLQERRGVERGFRRFEEVGVRYGPDRRPLMQGVGLRVVEWLDELRSEEDWFAYVHFNDLDARWSERWERHGPRLEPRYPPRPALGIVPPVSLRSPAWFTMPEDHRLEDGTTLAEYEVHYDTAVHWVDRNLWRLIDMLDQAGKLERTTIVIAGTFGVGFGEGGLLVDSGTLAPCDLRVPLLVRPAPELLLERGRRIEELVGLADVAPTLLALHGLPVPEGMHGANLLPWLRGRDEPPHEALFASGSICEGFAVVTEEHHYAWWEPRDRGPATPLATSWFGTARADRPAPRVLVPRDAPAADWLEGELVGEDPTAAALHAAGEARYGDLERARDVLHPSTWNAARRSPELVRELVEKGLVGGQALD